MKQNRDMCVFSGKNLKKKTDSTRSHPKSIRFPKRSSEFAEFLGIFFGDGSTCESPPVVAISLSYSREKEYALFISKMVKRLFNVDAGLVENKKVDNVQVRIYRVTLVRFFQKSIRKKAGVPRWVGRNATCLRAFLRGVMDAEGSVYRVERGKKRIRVEIKMHNEALLKDLCEALKTFGFHPRIYIKRKKVVLACQDEVDRYFNEICSHNPKHFKRYLSLRGKQSLNAPVV